MPNKTNNIRQTIKAGTARAFVYSSFVGGALATPLACHGEVFATARLSATDLDTPYLSGLPQKRDTRALTTGFSVGFELNEWFSVEGYTSEQGNEEVYKTGNLSGFQRDYAEFLDSIFPFLPMDTDVEATVEMKLRATGINVLADYRFLFLKAGVSRWKSHASIYGPEITPFSIDDHGYGRNYGLGAFIKLGKDWQLQYEQERYVLGDFRSDVRSVVVRYDF